MGGLNVDRKDEAQKREVEKLFGSVLWLNAKVLGLALGLLFGLVIFIATNWLSSKEASR